MENGEVLELLLSYVSCDGMNRHGRNRRRINEAMLKLVSELLLSQVFLWA